MELHGDVARVMQFGELAKNVGIDRKSTRLNSSHSQISYAVFCLKKKKNIHISALKRTSPTLKTTAGRKWNSRFVCTRNTSTFHHSSLHEGLLWSSSHPSTISTVT